MRDRQLILRRLGMAGVSVLCLVGALLLAWWQWERYESASGTWQNLGYVLQWPLFGLFPAFVFWRMQTLRRRERERQTAAPAAPGAPQPRQPEQAGSGPSVARAPSATRPAAVFAESEQAESEEAESEEAESEEDVELAEYNRYLAELNAKHQQERR